MTRKKMGLLAAGIGILALLAAGIFWLNQDQGRIPFYGTHQAGIATGPQKFVFAAAFDVTASTALEVQKLLKDWTQLGAALAEGRPAQVQTDQVQADPLEPPADTGETLGYKPARLTVTFGAGASLFDGRFGLAERKPSALISLPVFKGDNLNLAQSDGDLLILVGSDDLQTAYHGIHVLARAAKGTAVLRWVQEGFQPGLEVSGPGPGRNLQGFIDGTSNPDPHNEAEMNQVVWVNRDADWMNGGSYVVVRRIRMFVEAWDRTNLQDQEKAIGRHRPQGEEQTKQEPDSHVALAKGDGSQRIYRRPFHYVNGLDPRTGQWDAGLFFLAWMKDPARQYVPMQKRISDSDRLNEYIQPVTSAVFAVFPGVQPGSFVGAGLFPEMPLNRKIQDLEADLGALYPALAASDWTQMRKSARGGEPLWNQTVILAGPRQAELDKLRQNWLQTLLQEKPDLVAVREAQTALLRELSAWEKASTPAPAGFNGETDFWKKPLADTRTALENGRYPEARTAYQGFERTWASQEALVKTMDGDLYARVEFLDGTLRRGLQQEPPASDTLTNLDKLTKDLASLSHPAVYTAWDAGMILFREGLEALLVIAALLAFLRKTGQKNGALWVWSGAGAGLALSIGAAFGMTLLLAGWTAAPNVVEGVAGTAAVALMLTAGAWLHGKAAIKNWNQWIQERMGRTSGRTWLLGLLAFLAVLREGGETVVFYAGMARSLGPAELVLGIAGGLGVLAVMGVLILGLSKRLPLRWFFLGAELLIFYLAVKILGQSLASLQSAGLLPLDPLGFGFAVEGIGFTPTWETALPQILLAAVLVTALVRSLLGTKKKKPAVPG